MWQAFNGNWVNGLWLAFIGWFLRTAAQETYAQVAIQSTLAGLRAADIMTPDVPTVPRDMSLEDYVQEVLRTGRRCHIVTGNGVPVGLVTLHAVSDCPREEWNNTSVQAAMRKIDEIQWAAPAESVLGILNRMRERDINQMPVLEEGRIVGIVARDAILRVLANQNPGGRPADCGSHAALTDSGSPAEMHESDPGHRPCYPRKIIHPLDLGKITLIRVPCWLIRF